MLQPAQASQPASPTMQPVPNPPAGEEREGATSTTHHVHHHVHKHVHHHVHHKTKSKSKTGATTGEHAPAANPPAANQPAPNPHK